MTETTKIILEKYQIRKSKKQKEAFRGWVLAWCEEHGYNAYVEKGSFGAKNIVVGNIDSAKIVCTAHYDTCSVLPFPNFITPKNFSIYLLYQLVITFAILVPGFAAAYLIKLLLSGIFALSPEIMGMAAPFLYWLCMMAMLFFLTGGPANKHTANDNTSGVTLLFDIMAELPEERKGEAAFVFFDLEEAGLFGSMGFASKHKKQMKSKPLINFDCVSDGEYMIITLRKKARSLKETFEKAFPSTDKVHMEVLTKGVFYPSDQANFDMGAGAAALKKSKRFGFLYMDRIHTPKDTVYREENIEYLKDGTIRLIGLL